MTKKYALSLLDKLEEELTKKEKEERKKPLADARRFIEQAKNVDAPTTVTFQNLKTDDVRVDIEVKGGVAFVCIAI